MTFDESGDAAGAGRRMRMHALVVLALTFVAGLALGWGVGHRVAFAAGGARGASTAAPGAPGATADRRAGGGPPPDRRSMKERLGLTTAQCAAIDSVFQSQRRQIDAFWRGPGSELRAILDSTRSGVRAVLDSGQRVALDSIEARRRRRGQEGGGRDGGPGGGRSHREPNFCGEQRGGASGDKR